MPKDDDMNYDTEEKKIQFRKIKADKIKALHPNLFGGILHLKK